MNFVEEIVGHKLNELIIALNQLNYAKRTQQLISAQFKS